MNKEEFRSKVYGCWMGKNIGGTLGMPMEWERCKNEITYYTHDLNGEPLPNDDLDIQIEISPVLRNLITVIFYY
ncbi:hypothetical protein [Eisenbergiella tayi]|uniref:hypothetical protein n=1 Tax=Eisenbergiella tayi TaxID=1432052 RepID=UPI003AB86E34